jgi:hypothetical protein
MPFDEIMFNDTIMCDDTIIMDDELRWESDEVIMTEMGEYLNPWCMYDDLALELDCMFDEESRTATIYRELNKGVQSGRFQFRLYNPNNSYLDTEAKFKVGVIAYDEDGNKIDLGDCTPGSLGYLKFSGSIGTGYQYNGYNTCSVNLPTDTVITRLSIVLTETSGKSISSVMLYLDDIQYIGVKEVGGSIDTSTDSDKPDNSNSSDSQNGSSSDMAENSNNQMESNTNNSHTGEYNPYVFTCIILILLAAGILFVVSKKSKLHKKISS